MNKKKLLRRSTIVPLLLLCYLGVMAYIGWSDYASGKTSPLYYFGIIGATLLVIALLYYNLRRRERLRSCQSQKDSPKTTDPNP